MNKEQILNGVIRYFDIEVAPKIPMAARWGGGALLLIAGGRIDKVYDWLSANTLARTLDIVDKSGAPDIELIADALAQSAAKYGKLLIDKIPGCSVAFSDQDVILLKQYIRGEK